MKSKIGTDNYHHHNNSIVSGIFLVLIGVLFLLNNLGTIPWKIWSYIIGFWPVFLIIAGIKAIIGNNLTSRIIVGIISVLILVFVLIYGLYMVGSPIANGLPSGLINFINNLANLRK